ncbi:MAG TPA: hypothetical protein VJ919_03450 [Tangfeifania sp.]|nr:hypothetical protein [Tangfeifania sp.]
MKTIRNMRELKLMKKQLQYKEQLYEKEMIGSSANVFENLSDSIRDFAFEFGMKLATRLVTGYWRHKNDDDKDDD